MKNIAAKPSFSISDLCLRSSFFSGDAVASRTTSPAKAKGGDGGYDSTDHRGPDSGSEYSNDEEDDPESDEESNSGESAEKGVKDPARNALSAEDWTELESRVSAYAEAKRDGMPGLVEFGDQPPQPDGSSGGGPSSSSSYYNGWGRSHGPFSATSP